MNIDNYHPVNIKKAPSHGTLNLKNRIAELDRIDRANEKIKGKLYAQRTHYPAERFERSAQEQERIRRNMLFNSSKRINVHL